jgi:hypothetical protein
MICDDFMAVQSKSDGTVYLVAASVVASGLRIQRLSSEPKSQEFGISELPEVATEKISGNVES